MKTKLKLILSTLILLVVFGSCIPTPPVGGGTISGTTNVSMSFVTYESPYFKEKIVNVAGDLIKLRLQYTRDIGSQTTSIRITPLTNINKFQYIGYPNGSFANFYNDNFLVNDTTDFNPFNWQTSTRDGFYKIETPFMAFNPGFYEIEVDEPAYVVFRKQTPNGYLYYSLKVTQPIFQVSHAKIVLHEIKYQMNSITTGQ